MPTGGDHSLHNEMTNRIADIIGQQPIDQTLQMTTATSASQEEVSTSSAPQAEWSGAVGGAVEETLLNPSNCDENRSTGIEDVHTDDDVMMAEDLGSVAADLREVSEALRSITRHRHNNDDDHGDTGGDGDVQET